MRAFMKRNRLWGACVLLVLSLGAAVYAQCSLAAVPGHFQYLWPAPAPTVVAENSTGAKTNAGLKTARQGLDTLDEALEGACQPVTLYAVADGVSVIASMDNATAATARLEAVNDGVYRFRPLVAKSGRLLYSDELLTGERVALLDEKLAVALFNYAEPLDRYLLLNKEKYRIVGIVDDSRHVGDHQEYTLYVPYRAVEKGSLAMDALCVETEPIPNAGGWTAFESGTANLSTQGTAISLPKEAMNAALPLRTLLCIMGFLTLLFALRALSAQTVRLYRAYRERLRGEYAMHLLPWAAAHGLPVLVGFAVCAVGGAWLFTLVIEPVYTFPEWIPAVLVEPKDISAAFWNVWQKQAALFELRSPELIRIRFFARLMGWACGGLALAGGTLAARLGDVLRPLMEHPARERDAENPGSKYSLE